MLEENGDVTRAIEDKPAENPDERGDKPTEKSEAEESPAKPKSAEEKKND